MFAHCDATRKFAVVLLISLAFVFAASSGVTGQTPSYLVTAEDGSISVYDLANSTLQDTIAGGSYPQSIVVGANPRLAFVAFNQYVSVFDLTLGREIKRFQNIWHGGGSMTFSADGRWLLVPDVYSLSLDIIDPVRLEIVRKVRLGPAMGNGVYSIGSVVAVRRKAYVTTTYPDTYRPAIAMVDLRTFTVRPVAIPAGNFDGAGFGSSPNTAATPDGRYVVMAELDYGLGAALLFLNTATNTIDLTTTLPYGYDPIGLVITPVSNPAYGYVLGWNAQGNLSATVLDLRPASPTFGQLMPNTEVAIGSIWFGPAGFAIDAQGKKLAVTGQQAMPSGPQTNAWVVDTSLMLTDPSKAITGTATVAGGAETLGLTIAAITTVPPPTAPSVTAVSGPITNNAPADIHVTGKNFAPGALVRIGSMPALAAKVNSGTDLEVTVPVNAPAAPGLDVVVTNSGGGPPAQQNQSGMLAGGLTIHATPLFQPKHQVASLNVADGSVSVFDVQQRAMVNVATAPPARGNVVFNGYGSEVYSASMGYKYFPRLPYGLSINPATKSLNGVIGLNGQYGSFDGHYQSVASSVNPATGRPVTYLWGDDLEARDLLVYMIDADPGSVTFNRVIATLPAQITGGVIPQPLAGAATPDGKFVYVCWEVSRGYCDFIAIFDVVHGGPATILQTYQLGVDPTQPQVEVTPDGQSLLLLSVVGPPPGAEGIAVFDIGVDPKNPTLVTTIVGTSPPGSGGAGPLWLFSHQVVGNRLFAFDNTQNLLVAFNFDRAHGNFSQLGAYRCQGFVDGGPYIAVSPDGNLIYVPFGADNMVSIFDANLLASGQAPLITNLADFHSPSVAAVSPVAHSGHAHERAPDVLHRTPILRHED